MIFNYLIAAIAGVDIPGSPGLCVARFGAQYMAHTNSTLYYLSNIPDLCIFFLDMSQVLNFFIQMNIFCLFIYLLDFLG